VCQISPRSGQPLEGSFPQFVEDVEVLIGDLVTLVVFHLAVVAEVAGRVR